MKSIVETSRRRVLQMLAGIPMLPLSTLAGAQLLSGCGGGGGVDTAAATLRGISFSPMAAPTLANPAAMATTTVGSVMSATFSDAS